MIHLDRTPTNGSYSNNAMLMAHEVDQNDFFIPWLVSLLKETKAEAIIMLDLANRSSITDTLIICSGRSARHVSAIADQIQQQIKEKGITEFSQERDRNNEWIVIDFGDAILHIMQPAARIQYDLEGLWEE